MIPNQLLRPFDERELELVIGGISSIDVNDWKTHTRLKHCTPDTPQVQWFWQVIHSFNKINSKIKKIKTFIFRIEDCRNIFI